MCLQLDYGSYRKGPKRDITRRTNEDIRTVLTTLPTIQKQPLLNLLRTPLLRSPPLRQHRQRRPRPLRQRTKSVLSHSPKSLPKTSLTPAPLPPAFLSYLRLSVYMAIVSIAIVVSFHLKSQPSRLELRMAKPLGIVFWLLSLSCLALGFGNYIKTVNKYSKRAAIVQTGWKTQSVSFEDFFRGLRAGGGVGGKWRGGFGGCRQPYLIYWESSVWAKLTTL